MRAVAADVSPHKAVPHQRVWKFPRTARASPSPVWACLGAPASRRRDAGAPSPLQAAVVSSECEISGPDSRSFSTLNR